MEGQLAKYILPRFGASAAGSITETMVQEFVADLKRATFERRKPNGALIKTHRLSRKTILNIVGVLKLVLGRKVWMTWELDLGKPKRTRQPYFTQEQLRQIIEAAPEQLSGAVRVARRDRVYGLARRPACISRISIWTTG